MVSPSTPALCPTEVGLLSIQGDIRGICLPVPSRQNQSRGHWVGLNLQHPGPTCLPLSTAPDEAPTVLSVTPHTTTSVLIRWQVGQAGRMGLSPLRTQTGCALGPASQETPVGLPAPPPEPTEMHEKCWGVHIMEHCAYTCVHTHSTPREPHLAGATTSPTAAEDRDAAKDVWEWQGQVY